MRSLHQTRKADFWLPIQTDHNFATPRISGCQVGSPCRVTGGLLSGYPAKVAEAIVCSNAVDVFGAATKRRELALKSKKD
mmetsp:Transcript_15048/g.38154  ORF Transcript_15048/g.38154 Transcript_15048/m.38154 type:complete len:80 (-) Transcript_15048:547-786(-)